MEVLKHLVRLDAGDCLKLDLSIVFSKDVLINTNELKAILSKAIKSYYGDSVHGCY